MISPLPPSRPRPRTWPRRRAAATSPLFPHHLLLLLLAAFGVVSVVRAQGPLLPTGVAIVSAAACAGGRAYRPCMQLEKHTAGYGNATQCPCPYVGDGTGGPGPVKRYTFSVEELVLPSRIAGVQKVHITVNGQMPGPTIDVDEGDWLEVTVTNNMRDAPTTIHWHGQLEASAARLARSRRRACRRGRWLAGACPLLPFLSPPPLPGTVTLVTHPCKRPLSRSFSFRCRS